MSKVSLVRWGYYGGGIAGALDQRPRVPLMLHFGELDQHIPMSDVAKIREALPDVPVYSYDADHGFNCTHRESYNEDASKTDTRTDADILL